MQVSKDVCANLGSAHFRPAVVCIDTIAALGHHTPKSGDRPRLASRELLLNFSA